MILSMCLKDLFAVLENGFSVSNWLQRLEIDACLLFSYSNCNYKLFLSYVLFKSEYGFRKILKGSENELGITFSGAY